MREFDGAQDHPLLGFNAVISHFAGCRRILVHRLETLFILTELFFQSPLRL